jgi:hypothetical protein
MSPRYFLDPSSIYHIKPCLAQLNLTNSCLTYVNDSALFLRNEQRTQRLVQIVKGERAIHRYAWANWLLHLTAYSDHQFQQHRALEDDLQDRVQRLCWIVKDTNSHNLVGAPIDPSSRTLSALGQESPQILRMIQVLVAFKSNVKKLEMEADTPLGKFQLSVHRSRSSTNTYV